MSDIPDVEVQTFGCRLNAFESEVIREHARAAGCANTVIFNTCAVTGEAERQARQAIRRLRRERPDAKIVVTGCAAQLDPDKYAALPEVDRVVGNIEKMAAETWCGEHPQAVEVTDIMAVRETAAHLVGDFAGRARAFVEIQQGCDHRCTFCIIPFARGNNRSVPIGGIVEQVRRLVENGFREVVLTGVDITGYGADLPGAPTLGGMARRLLAAVPDLPRLRLSSIDPAEADRDLMDLIADEPRLMPHLHLSLQAGDDMILKRMKRRHSRAQAVEFCAAVRKLRPNAAFGADLIAGFPTETEAMFENSLGLIADCGLTHLHVFPFSARAGAPAAKMPQLPARLRKARAARLRSAGEMAFRGWLDTKIGAEVDVLIEKDNAGYSEDFAPVQMTGAAEPGAIMHARVTARDGDRLVAGAA
ncbi:MAG: tRNA (N(6)-L-threonylcarbamoyladenosine(37)-C(2))-methylthiotransferase MtaB [Rhodospirillales bacterium]